MKVTTISYEMKRSNGNYGSDGVALTAELTEGEDPSVGLARLEVLADYQLNRDRRETEADKQRAIIANEDGTDLQKERAHRYIAKLEAWLTEVEEVREAMKQD